MKKYHVYGIGNALVDMEFEVSTDSLTQMNVEKGLMTLVEQERQEELLGKLEGGHVPFLQVGRRPPARSAVSNGRR